VEKPNEVERPNEVVEKPNPRFLQLCATDAADGRDGTIWHSLCIDGPITIEILDTVELRLKKELEHLGVEL
jgi:hypothetical protein